MQERDAKMLFDAGAIHSVYVVPHVMGDGWGVAFDCKPTVSGSWDLEAQSGGVRRFASLDTAMRTLARIGFGEVRVDIHVFAR